MQIHADIRPDIFIPGTTKYTTDELTELLKNEEKPVYVAADEADVCVGDAFSQLKEQPFSNNMIPESCISARTPLRRSVISLAAECFRRH